MTIPGSVKAIGDYAFANCSNLTEIYINAENPPTIGTNTFADISTKAVFYIPNKTKKLYKEAWGKLNYKQEK